VSGVSKRLDLYRTLGVCAPCLTVIEHADKILADAQAVAAAPARAAAQVKAASTRFRKRLTGIQRRDRAARTREYRKTLKAALEPLRLLQAVR